TQITMLKDVYLGPRRDYLYNTLSAIIPPPQPVGATVEIGVVEFAPASGNQDQEYIEIINNNAFAIDISDWTLAGDVDHTFKSGTVLPVGGKLYLTPDSAAFRARTTGPSGNQGLFVQGGVSGHLSSFGGALTIYNTDGVEMTTTTFEGDPSAVQQFLRVTELMYHPSNPTAAEMALGYTSDNAFEYVELVNTSTTDTLDLTGVRFTAGISFDFTASAVTSLLPGGRVLAVRDAGGFAARYPAAGPVAGEFIGALDNSGERIKLEDAQNGTVLEFTYNDVWYPLTDGPGFSLVARDPLQDRGLWDNRTGWMPSDASLGSPGAGESGATVLPGTIVINEVMSYGTGPQGDRIELFNTSSSPVDISGWYLSNSGTQLDLYQLPTLPAMQGGGYLVLNETTLWGGAFTIPIEGGTVILQAASGGNLIGYQTRQNFEGSDPDKSFGPYTKSDGDVDFVELVSTSFGAENSAPRVGPIVINELMYNPPTGGDEYIELKNISASPVDLGGWLLTDAVDYSFAATTLAAGEYLIVSSIDPTAFRTKHGVPLGIDIVGPYAGALNNAGENVRLYRPGDGVAFVAIDRVNYGDSSPWPSLPDGGGSSLARSVAGDFGNDPANWTSDVPGGTPGRDNGFFDDTAPTTPAGLSASIVAGPQIALSWNPSSDPQSGIGQYLVYRDGALLATTANTSFVDTAVVSGVAYSYQVAAANPSQVSSIRSSSVSSSIVDLVAATGVGPTAIRLSFNAAVDAATANVAANYFVSGATVSAAAIQAGGTVVLLTTSPLVDGQGYRVVANNVANVFGQLQPGDRQATFVAGIVPGLAAQYFNDPVSTNQSTKWLPQNLALSRVDPNLNFNTWLLSSPAAGVVNNDYFSARWTGQLESLAAGEYTITISSDDGSRVWIGDLATPLLERTASGASLAVISLAANTKYDFKAEYFENTLLSRILLNWTPPGGTSTAIPASQFSQSVNVETTPPHVSQMLVASSQWTDGFFDELAAQGLGSGGVDVAAGATSAVLPWTNLDQVKVRFDSDVFANAGCLTVGGVNVANYGIAGFDYDYATFTATWTLAQPIALDRATIALAPTITDLVGNSLVGVPATTIRGGVGDVNGDGSISTADRSAEIARQFTGIGHANYSLRHDINGDGYINAHDAVLLQQRFGQSLPSPAPAAAAIVLRADMVRSAAEVVTMSARRAARLEAAARRVAVDRVLDSRDAHVAAQSTRTLRARRLGRPTPHSVDATFDLPTL
ncbi:MAG: lamin tail domain-containing protein, partial [Pirellulales bacterium]